MPIKHTVVQGDSISSIGFAHGIHPDTVWNDPDNADLRALRGDPNTLFPGDVVTVPDKRVRTYVGATDERHRFQRKGVPARLRVQFFLDDRPRADEVYTLEINAVEVETGLTDANGAVEVWIPPSARTGRILFHGGAEAHDLSIGHLDPIDELSGVQGRLRNLGFFHGAVDGELSDALELSLQEFQASHGLDAHGLIDDPTRDALVRAYGE
ncbi:peptidoglycan-binding protein [Enhygromyxa salina]|uniref:Putative peptidoglycan binding domain protein n=1 Tax=Enhygromyxa salina TaxID=215803 RepID=A0A2S9Y0E8_9BACT|nr:peptidoglycan-binding protein [Enhygromyxa salina]PRP98597.1 putative peptidoglycan binding domain protein [Enhygromyxa salina]